eukprot:scaffold7099_cov281-Pinguiococcus_pyrenoidosus.AAC.3
MRLTSQNYQAISVGLAVQHALHPGGVPRLHVDLGAALVSLQDGALEAPPGEAHAAHDQAPRRRVRQPSRPGEALHERAQRRQDGYRKALGEGDAPGVAERAERHHGEPMAELGNDQESPVASNALLDGLNELPVPIEKPGGRGGPLGSRLSVGLPLLAAAAGAAGALPRERSRPRVVPEVPRLRVARVGRRRLVAVLPAPRSPRRRASRRASGVVDAHDADVASRAPIPGDLALDDEERELVAGQVGVHDDGGVHVSEVSPEEAEVDVQGVLEQVDGAPVDRGQLAIVRSVRDLERRLDFPQVLVKQQRLEALRDDVDVVERLAQLPLVVHVPPGLLLALQALLVGRRREAELSQFSVGVAEAHKRLAEALEVLRLLGQREAPFVVAGSLAGIAQVLAHVSQLHQRGLFRLHVADVPADGQVLLVRDLGLPQVSHQHVGQRQVVERVALPPLVPDGPADGQALLVVPDRAASVAQFLVGPAQVVQRHGLPALVAGLLLDQQALLHALDASARLAGRLEGAAQVVQSPADGVAVAHVLKGLQAALVAGDGLVRVAQHDVGVAQRVGNGPLAPRLPRTGVGHLRQLAQGALPNLHGLLGLTPLAELAHERQLTRHVRPRLRHFQPVHLGTARVPHRIGCAGRPLRDLNGAKRRFSPQIPHSLRVRSCGPALIGCSRRKTKTRLGCRNVHGTYGWRRVKRRVFEGEAIGGIGAVLRAYGQWGAVEPRKIVRLRRRRAMLLAFASAESARIDIV